MKFGQFMSYYNNNNKKLSKTSIKCVIWKLISSPFVLPFQSGFFNNKIVPGTNWLYFRLIFFGPVSETRLFKSY